MQVPEEVRTLIVDESQVLGRELAGVRTPRQLRKRLGDPALSERVAQPLSPVLDRICEVVGQASVPIKPAVGHTLVSATSAVGSTLSSGMEAVGAIGIEVPPAAASAFAAAGAIGIAAGLVEFYVTAATITTELRAGGHYDPALLRTGLLHNYLHLSGPPDQDLSDGLKGRLALAVLRRVATRWVPLIGIPISVSQANRDLARARRHSRELAAASESDEGHGESHRSSVTDGG